MKRFYNFQSAFNTLRDFARRFWSSGAVRVMLANTPRYYGEDGNSVENGGLADTDDLYENYDYASGHLADALVYLDRIAKVVPSAQACIDAVADIRTNMEDAMDALNWASDERVGLEGLQPDQIFAKYHEWLTVDGGGQDA